jgi:hypothetical protein
MTARSARTWVKIIMAAMGVCTPGGFFFLLALLTNTQVHLPISVWGLLDVAGGVGGWFLARRALA